MLELNIDKRISAAEALSNPWIQKNKSNIPIPDSTLKNIYKFEVKKSKKSNFFKYIFFFFLKRRLIKSKPQFTHS